MLRTEPQGCCVAGDTAGLLSREGALTRVQLWNLQVCGVCGSGPSDSSSEPPCGFEPHEVAVEVPLTGSQGQGLLFSVEMNTEAA